MSPYAGIEKREFLRVDYETKIEFGVFTDDELSNMPEGTSRNISACGILFTSSQKVEIGALIAVTLDIHTLNDVVEIDDSVIEVASRVIGRVVRVEEVVAGRRFDMGVCFVRQSEALEDEDVQQMIDILKKRS